MELTLALASPQAPQGWHAGLFLKHSSVLLPVGLWVTPTSRTDLQM